MSNSFRTCRATDSPKVRTWRSACSSRRRRLDGQTRVLRIAAVAEEAVTVDANHELAGVTLNFDVAVREVREATSEEVDHGHVHGPGGHQH